MIVMEKVKTGLQLSVQKLVMFVGCGLIVSNLVISNWIYELVAFVPGVQLFIPVIVPDRSRFSEGICEA